MNKLILLLFPVFVLAQDYHEASGQTQSFTLAAGNKAGWNSSISVEHKIEVKTANVVMTLSPNPVSGNLMISVAGADGLLGINIYNVSGKIIRTVSFSSKHGVAVLSNLPNGIYFARLYANGKAIKSTRFLVAR